MKLHESITSVKTINWFNKLEEKFNNKHNNIYDYRKSIVKNSSEKIEIVCSEHGSFFQSPNNHFSGQGCPECGIKKQAESHRIVRDKFIERCIEVHGDIYDYGKTVYRGVNEKVEIICKKHGSFFQHSYAHTYGQGCPECWNERKSKMVLWNENHYKGIRTILYYVKVNDLYKIGLTKTTIEDRFRTDINNGVNVEILDYEEYQDGTEAYLKEQFIKSKFVRNRYIGDPIIKSGNSELFDCDIIEKKLSNIIV